MIGRQKNRRAYLLPLFLVFLLERIFVFSLLPPVVLVLGTQVWSTDFWVVVGALGLASDLLSGLPFGTWSVSYVLPIIVVFFLIRTSQFNPRTPLLASLGFLATIVGSLMKAWLLGSALSLPSRSSAALVLGWSLVVTTGLRLIKSRWLTEELRLRY